MTHGGIFHDDPDGMCGACRQLRKHKVSHRANGERRRHKTIFARKVCLPGNQPNSVSNMFIQKSE